MTKILPLVVVLMFMGSEVTAKSQGKIKAPEKTENSKELWLEDFGKAIKEAKKKDLPVMINFSGSDWCGWCIKLDKEVFSTDKFRKFARKNLVLVLADFPRAKEQEKAVAKQNKKLLEKYGVMGFPTILLVDSKGKVIARTGYRPGGPDKYVAHLKDLIGKEVKEKKRQ